MNDPEVFVILSNIAELLLNKNYLVGNIPNSIGDLPFLQLSSTTETNLEQARMVTASMLYHTALDPYITLSAVQTDIGATISCASSIAVLMAAR